MSNTARVSRNLERLCERRGYTNPEETVNSPYTEYVHPNGGKVLVCNYSTKVLVALSAELVKMIEAANYTQVLVCAPTYSPAAKSTLIALSVHIYTHLELSIDIMIQLPAHRKVTIEEVNEEFGLKVNPDDLPPIRLTDPAVKYYDFQLGDIIRVDEKSPQIWVVQE